MVILTANQMKNIDRRAIEKYNIPGIELMEKASYSVFLELQKRSNWREKNYIVLCGKGNNGGDGYEVARLLQESWCKVKVVAMCKREELTGDAALTADRLKQTGCPVVLFSNWEKDEEKSKAKTKNKDKNKEINWSQVVLVDGLLGTGLTGTPKAPYDEAIAWINEKRRAGAYVASIDLPSGLSADSGEMIEPAVQADLTVTFCCEKMIHRSYPARSLCGKIVRADIGIPQEAIEEEKAFVRLFEEEEARNVIPVLKGDAHKGTSGKLLVLGGSVGMAGAVMMNVRAALRSGSGLVSAMVPEDIYPVVASNMIEGMVIPMAGTKEGRLSCDNIPSILEKMEGVAAVLLGSGMGQSEDTREIVADVIKNSKIPMVIDADGINILSRHIDLLELKNSVCVLTPHSGEMARLCGTTVDEVEKNRIQVALSFAREHQCYIVLKGPATITASPTGECYLNTTGNPGMATGGSGDVLAGVIASFLARGIEPFSACAAAVYIHGLAGDIAAGELSQYGMIATDIIERLPMALKLYDCQEC